MIAFNLVYLFIPSHEILSYAVAFSFRFLWFHIPQEIEQHPSQILQHWFLVRFFFLSWKMRKGISAPLMRVCLEKEIWTWIYTYVFDIISRRSTADGAWAQFNSFIIPADLWIENDTNSSSTSWYAILSCI